MSRIIATGALLVVMLSEAPQLALAANPPLEPTGPGLHAGARPLPRVGFTLLAGLGLPACGGMQSCYGTFGTAPSLQALVLYQPHPSWAFGLLGQIERIHWEATERSMLDGTQYRVESDVTSGFAGLAARVVPLPELFLTPVVQVAVGWAFQERGEPYGCHHGARPAAQLAVGGRARVSSSTSVFVLASARLAADGGCVVFDAPSTPLAAWGFAFHAGASFDLPLGHAHAGSATPNLRE